MRRFDGDGMLHAVRINGRRASYSNSYVRTTRLAKERAAGRSLFSKVRDDCVLPPVTDPMLQCQPCSRRCSLLCCGLAMLSSVSCICPVLTILYPGIMERMTAAYSDPSAALIPLTVPAALSMTSVTTSDDSCGPGMHTAGGAARGVGGTARCDGVPAAPHGQPGSGGAHSHSSW